MALDWVSDASEIFINPRLPEDQQALIFSRLHAHPLKGHIWLSTSGSTGQVKWAALSKKGILLSASIVNTSIQSNSQDIWILAIPSFHIGGIGLLARSYLSRAKVEEYQGKWDPIRYHEYVTERKGTLTALVPAQVFDLVSLQLKCPPTLRVALIGGGALQESLYQKAHALGWPLIPTYSMTETSSSVALGQFLTGPKLPPLQVLPHMQVQINERGRIALKSPALLSLYAVFSADRVRFDDPKSDGWYTTEDLGKLEGENLTILGRDNHFIKIGGESVDLMRLEKILQEVQLETRFPDDLTLVAIPDPRLGHVIHLATTCKQPALVETLLQIFHARILPIEKVRHVHTLDFIPRSDLHKVLHADLIRLLT